MAVSDTLPVLPLRNTVLFPGVAVPISAGRAGTVAAVHLALEGDRRMLALAQTKDVDSIDPAYFHKMGTTVRIIQTSRARSGLQLLVQGERRARAVEFIGEGETWSAKVERVSRIRPDPNDEAFLVLESELRERSSELSVRWGERGEAMGQVLNTVDDPGAAADLVAFYLTLKAPEKQKLLEMVDDHERLHHCLVAVEHDLARIDAREDIQAQVQSELGERQREVLLREQLRAIRKELGEEEERDEGEEMRKRIGELELDDEQRSEVERELRRLERTNPQSAEYQVIRTYLEWIVDLPWNERTEEKIDLTRAEEILHEDHYGLEEVKDRILEFLAVRKLQGERGKEGGRGPILLFAGPPGVGKTSIARSIARALDRKYVRVSLGGARDEADIRGHRRTYVGAMPGRVIQGMKQAKFKNPVFLLDEADKLGVSFQGDPSAALLEVLDPAQNSTFVDHYLGIPFDLSEVLFIATANRRDRIPPPLLDRMELVEFSGYTEAEKLEIARRYLLLRQLDENGLTEEHLDLSDDAISAVIRGYTREAGVRQLEQRIGALARRLARRIAAGEIESMEVGEEAVREILGRPKVHPERMADEPRIGVATGMFYTPMGGDIMFVEVSVMPGEGKLVLTGQLGDVMKESGRAALSYTKAHGAKLGVEAAALNGRGVHIHVPAGAIPKDGPSAGITMATALVSAASGRMVRHDVAMTGELTLTGRVLPIGGVKEKVLGAVRAEIREVILPEANDADLEDIPEEVRSQLTIHLARTLDDVLEVALMEKKPV
ncbi:MAG: endopeptidase La [Gemmatimonadetes bacterium]|nr:endopeptidase La [Gemmatimonadota bacterium]